jgi:uncharacterized domain 1
MNHYRRLEKMYLNANINKKVFDSTSASISEGKASIGIQITEKYFHALGAIHGSVYFKLLDDAAFFAVSSIVKDYFVLTTSFNINLIKPVSKGKLTAHGKVRFSSSNLFTAEATLVNEKGQEVAFGIGNFAKSKIALTDKIGY